MSFFAVGAAALGLIGLWGGMFGVTRFVYRRAAGDQRRALDVLPPLNGVRELLARVAAGIAPSAVPILLCALALLVGGRPVPTTRVTAREASPAERAGVRPGDRIVAIDGTSTPTWQSVRNALEPRGDEAASHRLLVERRSERLTLEVIPDERGRIGVSPIDEIVPVSLLAALEEGAKLQLRVASDLLQAARAAGADTPELKGPIGIVREVGADRDGLPARAANLLWMLAAVGAWTAPAFLLGHLFDAATLLRFLSSNPEAAAAADDELRRRWRVARLRQLLLALIGLLVSSGLMWAIPFQTTAALVCLAWLCPLLNPVIWLLALSVRGRVGGVLTLLGLAVPVLNLVLIVLLIREAKMYLRNRGVSARW